MTTLSGTSLLHPITTYDQLGGQGVIRNKALAIPVHVGGAWRSVEYVELERASRCPTAVGEHVQNADELYLVLSGSGLLTTNGDEEPVGPGFLAIAPRGTCHQLRNLSSEHPLSLLVVELAAPESGRPPVSIPNLYERLTPREVWHPASQPLLVASVDLSSYGSAPWGTLRVVHLPPGTRVQPYTLPAADELLFFTNGFASILAGEHSFTTEAEEGLSVLVPAGMPRRMINHASGSIYPILLVSLEVRRETGEARERHIQREGSHAS
jgi:mannose-6-phosphate isomerase-like protein (cupin superfamily)